MDYHVATGQASASAPTQKLPAIYEPGSLAVGVGDFDNDAQNEIAVFWQGGGCSAPNW